MWIPMKSALILYDSKTGTTARFATEIGKVLEIAHIRTKTCSIFEFEPSDLAPSDIVLLGFWTNGLMLLFQHPERVWIEFAKQLPDLSGKKIGLFTTYLIATVSMFKKMEHQIRTGTDSIGLRLKSRNGTLNDSNRKELVRFIGENGSL
jgi:flavodoxin